MSEFNNLLLLFILLILLLSWTIKRKGAITITALVISLYVISCYCSLNFISNPLFDISIHASGEITLPSVLYFFCLFFIFLIPLLKFNPSFDGIRVNLKKFKVIYYIVFFSVVLNLIFKLSEGLSISQVFENFQSLREDSFTEEIKSPIYGYVYGYIGAFIYFSYFISMFALFVLRFRRRQSIIFFTCSILLPIVESLQSAGRAQIIFSAMAVLYNVILMKNYMSKKVLRFMIYFGAIIGGLIIYYIIYANTLRFSDTNYTVDFFLWKYAGESIVNFCGILYNNIKDFTYGISSFGLFRRFLGLEYFKSLVDLREYVQNTTGTPGQIFYTFMGNIFRDFGPIVTILFALLYAKVVTTACKFKKIIRFNSLLLIGFLSNLYLSGIFYFNFQSQVGNIAIILMIVMYFYMDGGLTIINSRRQK